METTDIEIIVEKYSDMIMRIAYQNCFNKSDAEDIVQDVFIKLFQNIEKIQSEEHMKSWLIIVTINLSKDYNKSAWYKKVSEIDENLKYFDEEEKVVLKELTKLKPVYRNIIYLYYYEGYKINEISKILNLNANTVSSSLSRARKQLGEILIDEGGELYV